MAIQISRYGQSLCNQILCSLENVALALLGKYEMPSPRILIVDDSSLLRSALRGLFSSAGNYDIAEAEDGKAALSMAGQQRPDVIVMDFAMPAMDGLAATRELRKRMPEVPILMYTMHYTPQLVADAKSAGVKKLISKSDGVDLIATVRELLASSHPPKPDASNVRELVFEIPATRSAS
jgi:DNA-binding NarL/FixJ family response regulator